MTKLVGAGFALALSLAACVTDDDVGTPPQPTDGQEDEAEADHDRVPIDPSSGLSEPTTPCASFDGKEDDPCAP